MSKFKILTSVLALSANLAVAETVQCNCGAMKNIADQKSNTVYTSTEGLTDGFYLGLTGGVIRDSGKENLEVTDNNGVVNMDATRKLEKTTPVGGIVAGYMRVFPNTFMSLEAEMTGPQTWSKKNSRVNVVNGVVNATDVQTKYRQDFAVALIQKFGWRFAPATAAYLRAGPVFAQFSSHSRIANHPRGGVPGALDNQLLKRREKVFGVDVGFGFVHQFSEDWIGSIDFSHRRFQNVKHDFEDDRGEDTIIKVKPKQTRLMMTLSYKL
ncbi:MAG: hypothetical protein CMM87_05320 [Rickettsiales bacterium]|nr:hypothetical protein [Rickettsiales bacterium]|tara:strand:- start:958 stop:1761 length:804 start_codon:yes stop_codon:yes gene_type:complete